MAVKRFYREREKLVLRLDEVIRGYLSDAGIPEVNDCLEYVYDDSSIGTHTETHEMRFFLHKIACFTPEFANRLQRLLAAEFPRWTVVPQFDEWTFTVAPDTIILRDSVIQGPLSQATPAYQSWLADATAFDKRSHGPLRRQLRWLYSRIPAALGRLPTERVVPMAVFDQYRRPDNGKPIWLLLGGSDWYASLDAPELAAAEYKTSAARYAVDATGTIHPQYSKQFSAGADNKPAGWLHVFVPETHPGPRIDVLDGENRVIARIQTPLRIPDETLRTENRP